MTIEITMDFKNYFNEIFMQFTFTFEAHDLIFGRIWRKTMQNRASFPYLSFKFITLLVSITCPSPLWVRIPLGT
jgi:hypothetical protein